MTPSRPAQGPSACRPVLRVEASIHPSSTSATMTSLIQHDGDELAGLDHRLSMDRPMRLPVDAAAPSWVADGWWGGSDRLARSDLAAGAPGHRDQPTTQGEDSDEDAEGRDKPVGLPGRFGSWHRDAGLGQRIALALTEPLHRVTAGRRLLLGGALALTEPLHRVTAGGLGLRDGGHTQAHSP